MNQQILKNKYLLVVPAIISLVALLAVAVWGLKPGIDIAGGSLLQVSYPNGRPEVTQVQNAVAQLNIGEVRVQPSGDNAYILRQRDLSNDEKNALESSLQSFGEIHEDQFNSVGPVIGKELLHKGLVAL